ncbi:MAG: TIGR01459 family HAD-type hydrolase [Methylobacterium sp.]|nr:TIGR01459 family HAD-type hydrolase [Methylobacterium sp.]MCA3612794.1 TIGR01459 family HAD-type hydrolase [Methylobacterium sp.]
MSARIQPIARLSDVIDRYDAIISDVWGVLHNGVMATPGAQQALAGARRAGKPVALLTNSPRLPHLVADQLRDLGVVEPCYDALVSSGGVTRELLESEGAKAFYHIGPARDSGLFEGLEAPPAPLEAAELMLCTGLFDDETETPEQYRPMLEAARATGLRLYCANPDLVVERGDRLIPCAGAIADLYEKMGGAVIWVGKPKPMVYERARQALEMALGRPLALNRVLCIGDAFRTDIAGANAEGHDVIMTLAGIHGHQIGLSGGNYDLDRLEKLATNTRQRPTYCMVSLVD